MPWCCLWQLMLKRSVLGNPLLFSKCARIPYRPLVYPVCTKKHISLYLTLRMEEFKTKRVKLSPDVESLKVTDTTTPAPTGIEVIEKPILVQLPEADRIGDITFDASIIEHSEFTGVSTDTIIPASISESIAEADAPSPEPIEKVWKPLVWVDCEMTGLNVYNDNIIEICCLITDGNLNLIDEQGYESTVYVPKEKLDAMDEWCLEHHGSSGLIDKVLGNKHKTIDVVQGELLAYIQKYMGARQGVLAGNTIHMDRFFMNREMPKVVEFLHYRIVDVSSIMEIGFRHNPELMKKFPKKKGAHTARSDILESLEQLRWYRDNYFVQPLPKAAKQQNDDKPALPVVLSKDQEADTQPQTVVGETVAEKSDSN